MRSVGKDPAQGRQPRQAPRHQRYSSYISNKTNSSTIIQTIQPLIKMPINAGNVFSAKNLSEYMLQSLPQEPTPQIRNPWDAIALLNHACMLAVGFRLVGLGEDHKIGTLCYTHTPANNKANNKYRSHLKPRRPATSPKRMERLHSLRPRIPLCSHPILSPIPR